MLENNIFFKDFKTSGGLIPFDRITTADYEPAIRRGIQEHEAEVEAITGNEAEATFENTIVALDRAGATLNRVLGVFYPMLSANADDALMQVSNRMAPVLSEHFNSITLNEHLLYVWCRSAAEPGNAWYFIFVPKDELVEPEVEPVEPKPTPEPAWFRPEAETNLLGATLNYESWFSGADWAGGLTPGLSFSNDIKIVVPEGIGGGEWMGQFKIHTLVPAGARERFDFCCRISSTQTGTATVKMTSEADGEDSFFYNGNVEVAAGETVTFEEADHMLFDGTESILLVFDFGRFPAGAEITISGLCLQKHIPLSEKPE